jgi:hypothetical protein
VGQYSRLTDLVTLCITHLPAVTKDSANQRTDEYGGSIERRCRVGRWGRGWGVAGTCHQLPLSSASHDKAMLDCCSCYLCRVTCATHLELSTALGFCAFLPFHDCPGGGPGGVIIQPNTAHPVTALTCNP